MQVDPAAFEICGHIVLKRSQDYETVTQVCTQAYWPSVYLLLWGHVILLAW